MKKRLICLIMCILMVVPAVLMSSCKKGVETPGEIVDKASEATITLTMYLKSEQHVCTETELQQIKTDKGETSAEYIEAKGIYEAHKAVEVAVNKITKAKYKTKLCMYWFTEDEYYKAVEGKIAANAEQRRLKQEATETFRKFKREQIAENIKDNALIKANFYEKYPQYAGLVSSDDTVETSETVAETVKNEYGMTELKYPDEESNQVDILYLGGYDNYAKYVTNGWLQKLDEELSSNGKLIKSYVNADILSAMKIYDGSTYAIPNNTAIGEYTFLLLNKELYNFYQYSDTDTIQSLADESVLSFLEDIKTLRPDYTPITGDLSVVNDFFWSVGYTYVEAPGITQFESGKYYYTKNADGTYTQVKKLYDGVNYFTAGEKNSICETGKTDIKDGVAVFKLKADAYEKATKFVAGVRYYTINKLGDYVEATGIERFADDVEYYKIKDSMFEPAPAYSAGINYYTQKNGSYINAGTILKFASKVSYFKIVEDAYEEYGKFDGEQTYYTTLFSVKRDDFSVFGGVYNKNSTIGTKLPVANIFETASGYTQQLKTIQKIYDSGYYSSDTTKPFASAVIKGSADVYSKYSDEYEVVVLEYPRVYSEDFFTDMFGISTCTKDTSRSMRIVTYLNTDADFRNLIQYGIKDVNYTVSEEKIDGVVYPKIKRLNQYYMMDLNATGNKFIAYPEEGMSPDIWHYAKLQNKEALQNCLFDFNFGDKSSLDTDVLDEIARVSAEWKEKINACTTYEQLQELLSTAASEVRTNKVVDSNINNTVDSHCLYYIYTNWYDKAYPSLE